MVVGIQELQMISGRLATLSPPGRIALAEVQYTALILVRF